MPVLKPRVSQRRWIKAFRRFNDHLYYYDPGPQREWTNQDMWRYNDFIKHIEWFWDEVEVGRANCPCGKTTRQTGTPHAKRTPPKG